MATSTLVQYLETARQSSGQLDPTGLPSNAVGTSTMDRRQTETFLASGAIVAGEVVSLDASKTEDGDKAVFVIQADNTAAATNVPVGVALAAAAAGEKVEVCVRGVCEARVTAGVLAGAVLATDGGLQAGQLDTIAAATEAQVAIALEAAVALPGTTTVYVRGAF